MKQACAILLLAILSFNWIGYQLVSSLMERKASVALDKKIDRESYDESQLREIRVPLNAPYMSGVSATFEPYLGEMEVDGVSYKYVKRKVDHGELVLLCLPNESKTKFEQARVDFFKLVNDLDHAKGNKEKQGSSYKSFTAEYKQEYNLWSLQCPASVVKTYATGAALFFPSSFNPVHKEPPRA